MQISAKLQWMKGWPSSNGWYWMRNFRHYRVLPVEMSTSGIAMMFSSATFTKSDTDIQEAEFYPISPPPLPPPPDAAQVVAGENAALTDAEVGAYLKAHENDPVDEESGWRIEWLFREKLATDALNAGREWLRSYQEDVVAGGRRVKHDMELLYSGTKTLIENLVRVIDTLKLEPTRPAATPPAAPPADETYVAFCRYVHHGQDEDSGADIITIETCDSDAEGAFKVYRHPALPAASDEPLDAELAEAQRLYEQTTGGKWLLVEETYAWAGEDYAFDPQEPTDEAVEQAHRNERWAVAAHNLWPRLVATLRAESESATED